MLPLRVYGQFTGYWSHAQVTRGLVRGLVANGIDVCCQQIDPRDNVGPVDCVGCGFGPPTPPRDGGAAFYVGGYPPLMPPEFLDQRGWRGALFITESSHIPLSWAEPARACDLVVVPSAWCAGAYRYLGVDPSRLLVVRHGLHAAYATPGPEACSDVPPRFLHVAGAASFLPRKGTDVLVEAFVRVFARGEATLTLRTPATPYVANLLERNGSPSHVVVERAHGDGWVAMPPTEMRTLLLEHDAVVQPSRAEAFGIVPLEARALGLPVILTDDTGHREHVRRGRDIVVQTGIDAPIAVNGIPDGLAPTVSVESCVRAFEDYREHRALYASQARADSVNYYARWNWEAQTKPLADRLREELT